MHENRNFLNSLTVAFKGLLTFIKEHRNAKIQLVIAVLVIVAGFVFKISKYEWISSLICIGMVLTAEAINSTIETLLDKLHPEIDKMIGKAKDISAAAVLIASIIAVVIGIIIFLPYLINLFNL